METEESARARLSALAVRAPDSPAKPGYADLVVSLAIRTLKIRYRGSVLGVFWSLSNPLLMTAIYRAIFGAAFSKYYGNSIANYVLAVFVALAVLAFFTASTSQGLSSIVGNGALLNKIALPYSVFPVSVIAANVFQLVAGTLPLLVIVTLYRTHSALNVLALAAPIAGLVMLSLGFALALSAAYVYFRDMPYLYEVFTFILYMTTPIFYPAEFVPAGVRAYLAFNPLATVVESVRRISLDAQLPTASSVWVPVVTGALVLAAGWLVLAATRRDMIDLL